MSMDLMGPLGVVIGVIGVFVSVYLAVKYAERKQPSVYFESIPKVAILKDAPESMEVFYEGKKVPRVSSTIVRFWNSGRRPIKKEDIPSAQPVLVKIIDSDEKVSILSVDVLNKSRDAINFTARKSGEAAVKLGFDFLDCDDGATIEIQHTGRWDAEVAMDGVILGAPEGIRTVPNRGFALQYFGHMWIRFFPSPFRRLRRNSVFIKVIATMLSAFVFGGMIIYILVYIPDEITSTPKTLASALSGFLSKDIVPNAVEAIRATSKYRTVNKILPYVVSVVLAGNFIYSMLVLWWNSLPFPKSLLIKRKEDRDNCSSEKSTRDKSGK